MTFHAEVEFIAPAQVEAELVLATLEEACEPDIGEFVHLDMDIAGWDFYRGAGEQVRVVVQLEVQRSEQSAADKEIGRLTNILALAGLEPCVKTLALADSEFQS